MIDDNNISSLLQEAKPLYFAQKRRKRALKSSFAMLVIVLGINFYTHSNSNSFIYNLDGLEEDIYATETGSYIETLGLPTDEYGFLEVV